MTRATRTGRMVNVRLPGMGAGFDPFHRIEDSPSRTKSKGITMTTRHLFALSLGFGAVILLTQAAQAQEQRQCAPRDIVLAQLAENYGESRQAIGLNSNNTVMEVFASEGGSWTITITMPNGLTCLAAAGEAYQDVSDEGLPPAGDQV